jgi:hypothetical protein
VTFNDDSGIPPIPDSEFRLFEMVRKIAEEWTGDEEQAEHIANDVTKAIVAEARKFKRAYEAMPRG